MTCDGTRLNAGRIKRRSPGRPELKTPRYVMKQAEDRLVVDPVQRYQVPDHHTQRVSLLQIRLKRLAP
jgi:hypothetical protein